MTLRDVAHELHVSLRTVQRYCSRGLGGHALVRDLDGNVAPEEFHRWLVLCGMEEPEPIPGGPVPPAPEADKGEIVPSPIETARAQEPMLRQGSLTPDAPLSNVPVAGCGNWTPPDVLWAMAKRQNEEMFARLRGHK